MITIQGKGVSKGIAKGPLYFFQRSDTTVTLKVVSDIEAEKARLAVAQEQSIRQLNALAEQCQEDAGEAMAVLFETHAMFVEDEDFVACITSLIDEESCNAEHAVEQAGIQFAAMFAAMDDAYMQARAADIKDVAKRILNNLLGVVDGGIHSDVPVILAADDLAPSETLQLDKSKILGFVTMGGSGNSHTAILARTMGIPAICGAGEALAEGYNGRVGYIDGETGQLIIDPDAMTQAALKEKYEKQQETKKLLETMQGFSEDDSALIARLNRAKLLIIDDLGTELSNSFTTSQLFLCLNERILRQKSTIISTNLNMNQVADIYSERVLSRISNSYTIIKLFGDDIRLKKRIH